ncbi:hypothetical protein D3C85_1224540 [compost metagenome]
MSGGARKLASIRTKRDRSRVDQSTPRPRRIFAVGDDGNPRALTRLDLLRRWLKLLHWPFRLGAVLLLAAIGNRGVKMTVLHHIRAVSKRGGHTRVLLALALAANLLATDVLDRHALAVTRDQLRVWRHGASDGPSTGPWSSPGLFCHHQETQPRLPPERHPQCRPTTQRRRAQSPPVRLPLPLPAAHP